MRTLESLQLGPFALEIESTEWLSWVGRPNRPDGDSMNVRLQFNKTVPCVSGTLAIRLDGGWVPLAVMTPDVTPFVKQGSPTTILDAQFSPSVSGYSDTDLIGREAVFHPGKASP